MSSNLILFPPTAEERAAGERNKRLFEWCIALLEQLGLKKQIKEAMSFEDLSKITIDVNDARVEMAIRDALHPASGRRAEPRLTRMHLEQFVPWIVPSHDNPAFARPSRMR